MVRNKHDQLKILDRLNNKISNLRKTANCEARKGKFHLFEKYKVIEKRNRVIRAIGDSQFQFQSQKKNWNSYLEFGIDSIFLPQFRNTYSYITKRKRRRLRE